LAVNVPVEDVAADRFWGFVGKKEKNKTTEEATNHLGMPTGLGGF